MKFIGIGLGFYINAKYIEQIEDNEGWIEIKTSKNVITLDFEKYCNPDEDPAYLSGLFLVALLRAFVRDKSIIHIADIEEIAGRDFGNFTIEEEPRD